VVTVGAQCPHQRPKENHLQQLKPSAPLAFFLPLPLSKDKGILKTVRNYILRSLERETASASLARENVKTSKSMPTNITIRQLPSDQFEDRPEGTTIDTLIIHSMYNPEAKNRFFALSCKECLDKHGVSSHYLIDLSGTVWQLISEDKKAWHAGISRMPEDGREGVNDFSIGIELIGSEDTDFTEAQYRVLVLLTKDILSRYPLQYIYGHYDIAPGRKTDPWGLDWSRYREDILRSCTQAVLRFSPIAATASTEDKGLGQY